MRARHLDTQGHLCVDTEFHRHSHLGNVCISTVGDWHPKNPNGRKSRKPEAIGSDYFYETLVQKFKWGEPCEKCDGRRHHIQGKAITRKVYQTQREALVGHHALILHYKQRAERHKALRGVR